MHRKHKRKILLHVRTLHKKIIRRKKYRIKIHVITRLIWCIQILMFLCLLCYARIHKQCSMYLYRNENISGHDHHHIVKQWTHRNMWKEVERWTTGIHFYFIRMQCTPWFNWVFFFQIEKMLGREKNWD